mmetsp:Transcript_33508/g.104394  ORF Transcript_33508/g.104394 Transcript_33508/m.104394 type:complete len:436 (+) Transcript_33508:2512-3819(+)
MGAHRPRGGAWLARAGSGSVHAERWSRRPGRAATTGFPPAVPRGRGRQGGRGDAGKGVGPRHAERPPVHGPLARRAYPRGAPRAGGRRPARKRLGQAGPVGAPAFPPAPPPELLLHGLLPQPRPPPHHARDDSARCPAQPQRRCLGPGCRGCMGVPIGCGAGYTPGRGADGSGSSPAGRAEGLRASGLLPASARCGAAGRGLRPLPRRLRLAAGAGPARQPSARPGRRRHSLEASTACVLVPGAAARSYAVGRRAPAGRGGSCLPGGLRPAAAVRIPQRPPDRPLSHLGGGVCCLPGPRSYAVGLCTCRVHADRRRHPGLCLRRGHLPVRALSAFGGLSAGRSAGAGECTGGARWRGLTRGGPLGLPPARGVPGPGLAEEPAGGAAPRRSVAGVALEAGHLVRRCWAGRSLGPVAGHTGLVDGPSAPCGLGDDLL